MITIRQSSFMIIDRHAHAIFCDTNGKILLRRFGITFILEIFEIVRKLIEDMSVVRRSAILIYSIDGKSLDFIYNSCKILKKTLYLTKNFQY